MRNAIFLLAILALIAATSSTQTPTEAILKNSSALPNTTANTPVPLLSHVLANSNKAVAGLNQSLNAFRGRQERPEEMHRMVERLESRQLFSAPPLVSAGPFLSGSVTIPPGRVFGPIYPAPVAAPAAVNAQPMSSSEIDLSWANTSTDGVASISVLRSTDGAAFARIASLPAESTTFPDLSLADSTQYFYKLEAVATWDAIADSPVVAATTASHITPGTGFTVATQPDPAVQHVDTTQPYSNDLAIARFDVVPYQTFSGEFNVGVVAFHNNGIKEVDFTVNGGPVTKVTKMTLNPQTANHTGVGNQNDGVVEYWATLVASDFPKDGQIEVRAIAYPTNGQARVLTPVDLFANSQQTFASSAVYVSATSGSDSNPGTQAAPVASISAALGKVADGGSIVLATAGSYIAPIRTDQQRVQNQRPVTIQAASGLSPSDVTIVAGAKTGVVPRVNRLIWSGVTFDFSSLIQYSTDPGGWLWFDECVWTYGGINNTINYPTPLTYWGTNPAKGFTPTNVYVTNSAANNTMYGFVQVSLARSCGVENSGGDVYRNSLCVINCTADHVDGYGTTDASGNAPLQHVDIFQYWVTDGTVTDNVIVDGFKGTNLVGVQDIFLQPNSTYATGNSFTNFAFVNATFQNQPIFVNGVDQGGAPYSQTQGQLKNIFFLNDSWDSQFLWIRSTNTDMVFENCGLTKKDFATYISPAGPPAGTAFYSTYLMPALTPPK